MYYWTNELWRLGYLVGGLGLLGWVLGEPGWGLAVGLGLFVFIHTCAICASCTSG